MNLKKIGSHAFAFLKKIGTQDDHHCRKDQKKDEVVKD
jgi:hypothetical protein